MEKSTFDETAIEAFGLGLASQVRNGEMSEILRLKSFSYYKAPLLLCSTNAYLVGANFDDDSFKGEGRILRKYLKPYKKGIFLVDKAICGDIEALPQFILGRCMGEIANEKPVSDGDFLFEFADDIEVEQFKRLFNSTFSIGNISVREIKRVIPAWGALVSPGMLGKHSMYMFFIAYGEQMEIIGPKDKIDLMRVRAQSLVRNWDEHEFFLDTVQVTFS